MTSPRRFRLALTAVAFAALAAGGALGVLHGTTVTGTDLAQRLSAIMPAAGTTADITLASHKALYSYKMVSVESGAGVTDIRGKMYFEQDDACDAWTTDQRFTTEYHYPERSPMTNTSRFVAWEAKDGGQFSFTSERNEGGQVEQLRGNVMRQPDTTAKAEYSRPDDLSFDLPAGYVLPTGHTAELIRMARDGKKIMNAVLFDGTDAEGPVEINVFIGKKATKEEIAAIAAADTKKIAANLLSPDAWHMRMAIFPLKDDKAAAPAYEMDVLLHDNGVVSYALVDYKTFKVEQKLMALEALAAKSCP